MIKEIYTMLVVGMTLIAGVCTPFSVSKINLKQQIEKTRLLNSDGDNKSLVEVLWHKNNDGGSFVLSTDVNHDGISDILVYKYALDGRTGNVVWTAEKGVVAGVGDVNNDDRDEVITKRDDRENHQGYTIIYCLNSSNGKILWQHRIISSWFFSVSIGNLTGNSSKEILIGLGDFAYRGNNYVYCLDGSNGSEIWKRHTSDYVLSTAIADLNNDGKNEAIIGTRSNDPRVYCLRGNDGHILWEFDSIPGHDDFRMLAVGNLTGDPCKEVVASGSDHLYCLNGFNGSILWTFYNPYGSIQSVCIASMNNSIYKQVIVGGAGGIWCLKGERRIGGSRILWYHPTSGIGGIIMSLGIGDIDKNGLLDVVAKAFGPTLYALKGQDDPAHHGGETIWTFNAGGASSIHGVICVDLTNDAFPEVVVINDNGEVYALFTNITPPVIEIARPKDHYLYLFDREIMPVLGRTIIIGKIEIEIDAHEWLGNISFYIDNGLKEIITRPPYIWLWDEKAIGKHVIKIRAYGKVPNDKLQIVIFNI